jgi:phage terminase large subunit-like protein
MVEASPILRAKLRVVRSTKVILSLASYDCFLKAISADGDAQDGINPHCVIVDELHRWKLGRSQELLNVLVNGTVTRKRPLVFEITTAGSTEDESPLAWRENERTRSIEAGDFSDKSFYGKIYCADPKDDVQDPATWAKANPSMMDGGFLTPGKVETLCTAAVNQPVLMNAFKRLHLGIWLSTETEYMPREVWRKNGAETKALIERPCYIGLDLSETTDLTSSVLVFPEADDEGQVVVYDVKAQFWMAAERVGERELGDRVPYRKWAEEGLLTLTEGNVIDLRDVKKQLGEWDEIFQVREVAYDPHHATQLANEVHDEFGLKCVPVPQRYQHMSEPTKKLMELALMGRLRHGGNPMLAWNMNCLRVRNDGNDNIRPVKPNRQKSSKRIDGAVALILALGRAMFHRPSVYESRGLLIA